MCLNEIKRFLPITFIVANNLFKILGCERLHEIPHKRIVAFLRNSGHDLVVQFLRVCAFGNQKRLCDQPLLEAKVDCSLVVVDKDVLLDEQLNSLCPVLAYFNSAGHASDWLWLFGLTLSA